VIRSSGANAASREPATTYSLLHRAPPLLVGEVDSHRLEAGALAVLKDGPRDTQTHHRIGDAGDSLNTIPDGRTERWRGARCS